MSSYQDLDIYKIAVYPEKSGWTKLYEEYSILGKKINAFIQYVEKNWKS